jgi:hypothetical protein
MYIMMLYYIILLCYIVLYYIMYIMLFLLYFIVLYYVVILCYVILCILYYIILYPFGSFPRIMRQTPKIRFVAFPYRPILCGTVCVGRYCASLVSERTTLHALRTA